MNLYAAVALVSLLTNGALGILVLKKDPRTRANQIFLLSLFFLGIWLFSAFLLTHLQVYPHILARMVLLGVVPQTPLFLHFSYHFPGKKDLDSRGLAAIYAPMLVSIALLPTDLLVSGVEGFRWGLRPSMGPLAPFLIPYFAIYIFSAYYNLLSWYGKGESKRRRVQIASILTGTGIFYVAGNAVYIGSLLMGMDLFPLAEAASVIMAGLITCSILNQEVLKIEPHVETLVQVKKHTLKKGMIYFTATQGLSMFSDVVTAPCPDCQVEAFPCESQDCRKCAIECPCSICDQSRIRGLFITPRDPGSVRMDMGLEATPGLRITPGSNMEDMIRSVGEFCHDNRPAAVLFELDTGKHQDKIRYVHTLIEAMKEDSILIVSMDSREVLKEVKDRFNRKLQEKIISTLSDPVQRGILEYVNKRERASFTSILEEMGMTSPSKLSYHLGKLKSARMLLQDQKKLYHLTGLGRMTMDILAGMERRYIEEITL